MSEPPEEPRGYREYSTAGALIGIALCGLLAWLQVRYGYVAQAGYLGIAWYLGYNVLVQVHPMFKHTEARAYGGPALFLAVIPAATVISLVLALCLHLSFWEGLGVVAAQASLLTLGTLEPPKPNRNPTKGKPSFADKRFMLGARAFFPGFFIADLVVIPVFALSAFLWEGM